LNLILHGLEAELGGRVHSGSVALNPEGEVRIWSTCSLECTTVIKTVFPVACISFSSDSSTVVTCGKDPARVDEPGMLQEWAITGEFVRVLPLRPSRVPSEELRQLTWFIKPHHGHLPPRHPNGAKLVTPPVGQPAVSHICFSEDGRLLASTWNHCILVRDALTGQPIAEMGHNGRGACICMPPRGWIFYFREQDIKETEETEGLRQRMKEVQRRQEKYRQRRAGGRQLSTMQNLVDMSLDATEPDCPVAGHILKFTALSFSPCGRFIASRCSLGQLTVWAMPGLPLTLELRKIQRRLVILDLAGRSLSLEPVSSADVNHTAHWWIWRLCSPPHWGMSLPQAMVELVLEHILALSLAEAGDHERACPETGGEYLTARTVASMKNFAAKMERDIISDIKSIQDTGACFGDIYTTSEALMRQLENVRAPCLSLCDEEFISRVVSSFLAKQTTG